MKKPTVTIFIPAFNEEQNIKHFLDDLITQDVSDFTLEQILVVSDGSTDQTVKVASSMNNPLFKVIDDQHHIGKVPRVNNAFETITSDIIVQLDADTRVANKCTISQLIAPFAQNTAIGIVCGNHLPLKPATFVEKLSYFGTGVWNRAINKLGDAGIMYRCCGHVRAFSKQFYKQFRLPLSAGSAEDTYCFYYAITHNFQVVFAQKALVEYRLPSAGKDYLQQMGRFLTERNILEKAFDESVLSQYETLTDRVKFAAFIEEIAKTSPIVVGAYMIIQVLAHLLPKSPPPTNGMWEVSLSTKKV